MRTTARALALGLAAVGILLIPAPGSAGSKPREVGASEMSEGDVEVVMLLEASPKEISNVRGAVLRLGRKIERFAEISPQAALEQIRSESPDETFDDSAADFLPVVFRMDVRDGVDRSAIAHRLEEQAGVDHTFGRPDPNDPGTQRKACEIVEKQRRDAAAHKVEVFMIVFASDRQVAKVRAFVESADGIERFRFFDKQDALEEFRRIFQDDPDIVEGMTADKLPTSFRVRLVDEGAQDAFVEGVEALAGVDDVAVPEVDPTVEAVCAQLGND